MTSNFEFQIAWYFVFWMSILCCAFANIFLKRFSKMTTVRYLVANFIVIFILMLSSSFFSYSKLSKIKELVSTGKVHTLIERVAKVDHFNGKDVVRVADETFEINHHDLYCISGKKILSNGDYVSLSYVELGKFTGFIGGNCIIKLENNVNNRRQIPIEKS
ncbi:hypothetical protein [Teredinibacter turnerae]|uniref:hypothetical protein n=1 Tax=Teredinibacter turnerae TaxID=2426 RepID=UPI0030CA66AD